MLRKSKLSIFVFRRDLRLHDNSALIQAASRSECILPCFIFDPRQSATQNPYFAHNSFQFMLESLEDLNTQLKSHKARLYLFSGLPHEVLEKVIDKTKADSVFMNEDYTPFAIKRDREIKEMCGRKGVGCVSCEDILLVGMRELPEGYHKYKVFTPFYNWLSGFKVGLPQPLPPATSFYTQPITFQCSPPLLPSNPDLPMHGGRTVALQLLSTIPKDYAKYRNDVNRQNTNLSAHNKFGTVSIREFYHACKEEALIRQLYWRDFYYHICVLNEGFEAFQAKYRGLSWQNDEQWFELWKEGSTGVPIVDAAMRCLKQTGVMHNRLRMVVASFLTKDLLIDWKWGEKHFAHYLVDYDPAQNNGGWQWASSTGTDPQPYFRVFNPYLQAKAYDKDCLFIKKWVPELKKVPAKSIHEWEKDCEKYEGVYKRPIVVHSEQRDKAIELFKGYGGDKKDAPEEAGRKTKSMPHKSEDPPKKAKRK